MHCQVPDRLSAYGGGQQVSLGNARCTFPTVLHKVYVAMLLTAKQEKVCLDFTCTIRVSQPDLEGTNSKLSQVRCVGEKNEVAGYDVHGIETCRG